MKNLNSAMVMLLSTKSNDETYESPNFKSIDMKEVYSRDKKTISEEWEKFDLNSLKTYD